MMAPHFARLERQLVACATGRRRIVPEAGIIIWRAFLALGARRTYHMSGPNPITPREVEAYCRLHRWPLQPHHVALICAMDDAWITHCCAPGRERNDRAQSTRQPMTPAIFDAVFG